MSQQRCTGMVVTINGEKKEFAGPLTLSGLLAHLELAGKPVAVEVNRKVIRKTDHEGHQLHEGDMIEIVQFVGGG